MQIRGGSPWKILECLRVTQRQHEQRGIHDGVGKEVFMVDKVHDGRARPKKRNRKGEKEDERHESAEKNNTSEEDGKGAH